MNEVFDLIVGSGTGYVAGQIVQQLAIDRAAENSIPLTKIHASSPIAESRFGGARRFISEIALSGLLTGGLAALAYQPVAETLPQVVGPTQAIDNLDFNYSYINGDLRPVDEPAQLQNSVAGKLIDGIQNFHLKAVNNGSIFDVYSKSQLDSIAPYGPPQAIQQAVSEELSSGFSHAPNESSNLLSNNEAKSGALLIFDDNESIGNTQNIVNQSQADGDIPVYIVNVGGSKNSPIAGSLKQITSQTHGHYWNLKPNNVQQVTKSIESTIHVHGASGESVNNANERPIFITLSVVGGIALYAATRQQIKRGPISRK